ncbi:hypothetical protein Ga0074115_13422 [endosymbiont of Ridgeia piscesae]|uniref:DUF4845 domain-containing protein n=2 Tax=endosymbiont of Ridgeia piscesae TaxID=54398 RepID=A0A0T5Z9I8_9GAMM|nr:hypothetical protein Ga0074115_13422 [endosymbiont of Ridgeia piscesae]KRT59520.1 protein of unknown function (DUF4845) [endosymbiont of Ridgeia piscesae]
MYSTHRESGMTAISMLLVFVMVGAVALMAIKIIPVYTEHFTVRSALESLQAESLIGRKSLSEIRKAFLRRMEVNYISTVKKEHVKVERQGSTTIVRVSYEVRIPLMGNLDAIVSFDDTVELAAN